jgi:hypothetical protein
VLEHVGRRDRAIEQKDASGAERDLLARPVDTSVETQKQQTAPRGAGTIVDRRWRSQTQVTTAARARH